MNNFFNILANANWASDFFRVMMASIDKGIYIIVQNLFNILLILKDFSAESLVKGMEQRIYLILGIFLIFKITFSLIEYLLSPDKINDKNEGAGKFISRVIISLIMLIMLPYAFSFLKVCEHEIVDSIPTIIFANGKKELDETVYEKDGDGYKLAREITVKALESFFFANTENCFSDDAEIKPGINYVNDITTFADFKCQNKNVVDADLKYQYTYWPFISTICGLILVYIVFSLCISVAIRSFKLVILRVVGPIAVLSYISPKSSKEGGMFSSWTKTLINVWAELFIYLAIVFFTLYMLHELLGSGDFSIKNMFPIGVYPTNGFMKTAINLILVLGLLFFAQSAPKFVCDALGIKSKGGFMKMLGFGAATAGIATGVVAGTRASALATKVNGGKWYNPFNWAKAALGGATGGVKTGLAGAGAINEEKGNPFKNVSDAQNKIKTNMIQTGASGSTAFGRFLTKTSKSLIGDTPYDRQQREVSRLETIDSTGKQLQDYLEDRAVKKGSMYDVIATGKYTASNGIEYTNVGGKLNDFYKAWNEAKQKGSSTFNFCDIEWDTYGSSAAALEGDLKAQAGKTWAEDDAGGKIDATLKTYQDAYVNAGGSKSKINDSNAVKSEHRDAAQKAYNIKNKSSFTKNKADAGNIDKK